MDVVHACANSPEKLIALPLIALRAFASRVIHVALAMMKRSKEDVGEMQYTSGLGRSTVTELVLWTLVNKGKLESLTKVRALGQETVPVSRPDEAVVFVAFLDAGLRLPCVGLVSEVLQLYKVELAQLTPNSIVNLGVFEWVLRSAGTSGEGRLFAYLHDG